MKHLLSWLQQCFWQEYISFGWFWLVHICSHFFAKMLDISELEKTLCLHSSSDVTLLGLVDLKFSSGRPCFWFPPFWLRSWSWKTPPRFNAASTMLSCGFDGCFYAIQTRNYNPLLSLRFNTPELFFPLDAVGNYFMRKILSIFLTPIPTLLGDRNWHHAAQPVHGKCLRQRTAGG